MFQVSLNFISAFEAAILSSPYHLHVLQRHICNQERNQGLDNLERVTLNQLGNSLNGPRAIHFLITTNKQKLSENLLQLFGSNQQKTHPAKQFAAIESKKRQQREQAI